MGQMGQLFNPAAFTNPGTALAMPGGGTFVGSPQQVLSRANQALGDVPTSVTADPNAIGGLNVQQDFSGLPTIKQPSMQEAAQAGALPGSDNAMSPGLSKAGKLAVLLNSGLRGALAGRAAQENMIAQTGGRRAGGVGTGFEAGVSEPFQHALAGGQVQQQQAQTALLQSQSQMVPTPYGLMPAGMARLIFPAMIRAGAQTQAATTRAGASEYAADQGLQGRLGAAAINHRYIPVPNVGLFDTNSRQVIPGTSQAVTVTPEIAADYGLPADFVGKPLNLSQFSSLERTAIAAAPTTTTTTDTLGQSTTSTRKKQLPARIAPVAVPGVTPAPAQRPAAVPGGAAATPAAALGGGTMIQSIAKQLVDGDMDPSQLTKRGNDFYPIMNAANQYSQQQYGKPFDVAKATTDYKFANEPSTQNTLRYLNSLTGRNNAGGNLDKLINISDSVGRTRFPAINDVENWTRLQTGSQKIADYHTAVTEVADQVAKILQGGGSGSGTSDAKLNQAASLFASGFSADQLKGVASTLRDLLSNRKNELIGDNRYLQRYFGNAPAAKAGTFDWNAHFVPAQPR